VVRCHYEDVVVPYRKERPWYQRGWRLRRRFGEIREETRQVGRWLIASLRALLLRAEKLLPAVPAVAQSGLFSRDSLKKLGVAVEALEDAERSLAKLATLNR
jgi:hypothetical protein